ncbi:P-loop NTPase fold protein [Flavobacterium sp.]|uniref:KAP family P-loop NTPase fold protein n=1 Tax=Flavobacterium sp. TaxID=239 RepID=UPI0024876E9E|nr:P-loop NTPase fold protein [Flavobacterium sp.]MDI1315759.1 P-loop NTPase fold protein [Flavobacterium sp.]
MNLNKKSNIIDKPRKAGADDLLGVDDYMKALIQFIETCNMPTTIAVQGEWGSGKTSMLNQIRYQLCETGVTKELDNELPYYGVWINTWQYSIMKTREETLLSIIGGLTNEISKIIKRKHETQSQAVLSKVSSLFGKIAKAGAKAAVSQIGLEGDFVDSVLNGTDETVDLLSFKNSLQEAINNCLELDRAQGNNNRGFIFFIDDLDRIDPPVAVEILELIKNIFEVDNCIFVLAIDYEVVVKGLIPKFGPLTDKNEREFRSFFDKIIQLPFSMPVAMYDVNHFLIQSLEDVGYINDAFKENESMQDRLVDFAMLSVGNNPRSLKRLINTLSLLNIIGNQKNSGHKETHELVVNFGLVCIQIAYPKIYQALLEEPDYKSWNEKTGKKMNLSELSESQSLALKDTSEFDEEWEIVLYRICQKDLYLSMRAFQVSLLLNYMSELIPENLDFGDEIAKILGTSSVTSVSLDYIPKQTKKGEKVRFEGWQGFEQILKDNNNIKAFIPELKSIHDYFESEYKDLVQFNYTPNFLTIACKNPKSRSRTFVFIRLKKDSVLFEYSGKSEKISSLLDFSSIVKDELKNRFNELSIKQLN